MDANRELYRELTQKMVFRQFKKHHKKNVKVRWNSTCLCVSVLRQAKKLPLNSPLTVFISQDREF